MKKCNLESKRKILEASKIVCNENYNFNKNPLNIHKNTANLLNKIFFWSNCNYCELFIIKKKKNFVLKTLYEIASIKRFLDILLVSVAIIIVYSLLETRSFVNKFTNYSVDKTLIKRNVLNHLSFPSTDKHMEFWIMLSKVTFHILTRDKCS